MEQLTFRPDLYLHIYFHECEQRECQTCHIRAHNIEYILKMAPAFQWMMPTNTFLLIHPRHHPMTGVTTGEVLTLSLFAYQWFANYFCDSPDGKDLKNVFPNLTGEALEKIQDKRRLAKELFLPYQRVFKTQMDQELQTSTMSNVALLQLFERPLLAAFAIMKYLNNPKIIVTGDPHVHFQEYITNNLTTQVIECTMERCVLDKINNEDGKKQLQTWESMRTLELK